MAPTPSKPFTFDRSFDLSALNAAEEARKAITFSEEEMALAKEQSYGQGFVAGKEAALKEIQQQQTTVLGSINRVFERFAKDVWDVFDKQKHVASDVGSAIARKLLPDYMAKHGQQEILSAIEKAVSEMINEPRLVLRINENNFDYIKREVESLSSRLGYVGKMIILADQTLGDSDCKLEWADGGMERNVNMIWSDIDRQLARHSAASAAAHAQPHSQHEPATSTTTMAV